MNEENKRQGSVSRRRVLKQGAVASGALLGVGTVGAGPASARGGGAGFFSEGAASSLDGRAFRLVRGIDWTLEHSPGCSGNPRARTRVFPGWEVRAVDNNERRHFYALSRNHDVGDVKRIVSARACPPDATATRPNGSSFPVAVRKVSLGAVE